LDSGPPGLGFTTAHPNEEFHFSVPIIIDYANKIFNLPLTAKFIYSTVPLLFVDNDLYVTVKNLIPHSCGHITGTHILELFSTVHHAEVCM
jgi:hypothetical protein